MPSPTTTIQIAFDQDELLELNLAAVIAAKHLRERLDKPVDPLVPPIEGAATMRRIDRFDILAERATAALVQLRRRREAYARQADVSDVPAFMRGEQMEMD